ncbi:arrestin domain-containing protein 3-like [Myxocyprinus asiaticus]|uniref:arrestin domain-containing protein 3-like n=1 Tax=Myxocyprinus asiaticus TaxID=70543 RepID=UPI00222319C6|nr:arrestin domain-containing protein 3-like [Myxocyprinus asiaticus]
MSLTVKNISVVFNPINQNNTFTNGDFISGQVILDVAKDTQMQSLSIKIKGKAEVLWCERHGNTTVVYSDKEKYYSMERFFVRDDHKHGKDCEMLKDPSGQPYSSVVAPGHHVYPFIFQLPQQNFPQTFKGRDGKVLYTLQTKLARSMRVSSKAKTEFHYVPRPDLSNLELMAPQYGTKDKQMKLFTSGSVSMNINTEKMGYYLGEGLKVLAEVQNNSSRAVKPKYCLYQKHSFFARGKRRVHTNELLKEEGEPIEPNTKKNFTKVLTIPPSLTASTLNCRILMIEYRLRVYLDVPYASDPEIKFPIVILPLQTASDSKGPSNNDFGILNQQAGGNAYPNPPPLASSAPPPNVAGPPGLFGAPGCYGPPPGQFAAPAYSGPTGQIAAPAYSGCPGQIASPAYSGPPGQIAAPAYSGPPGQIAARAYSGPPGQIAAPAYSGPPGQIAAPAYSGPPGQIAAPAYSGPPSQIAAPAYSGPPDQIAAPAYSGPPGQIAATGYPGPPGHFGTPGQLGPSVSNSKSDSSAPPPYQDYWLYPKMPDGPENAGLPPKS